MRRNTQSTRTGIRSRRTDMQSTRTARRNKQFTCNFHAETRNLHIRHAQTRNFYGHNQAQMVSIYVVEVYGSRQIAVAQIPAIRHHGRGELKHRLLSYYLMTELSELPHAKMKLPILLCSGEDADSSEIRRKWVEGPFISVTQSDLIETDNGLKRATMNTGYCMHMNMECWVIER
jgi:hypothetical protein